jgi:hypothetical protein
MKKRCLLIGVDSFSGIILFFPSFPSLLNIISTSKYTKPIYRMGPVRFILIEIVSKFNNPKNILQNIYILLTALEKN